MKTAVYCRVSTFDQNPENQLIELKEYIQRNNMELHKIFEDRTSGAKQSRPALNRLMEDARKGLFEHVVFWKIDRLGRNAIHTQTVVSEWRKVGITFTITSNDIDTSKPTGMFIFGIMAQYAQMERAMIIERTNAGLRRVRDNIEKNGYHVTKDGKKIRKLGRPKGSKDKKLRRKSGYYQRWANDRK